MGHFFDPLGDFWELKVGHKTTSSPDMNKHRDTTSNLTAINPNNEKTSDMTKPITFPFETRGWRKTLCTLSPMSHKDVSTRIPTPISISENTHLTLRPRLLSDKLPRLQT